MSPEAGHEGEAAHVYRAYNGAENARDLPAMEALLAPDIAVAMNGRPALASASDDALAMAALFAAYPDYHREIVSIVDGGDAAAVRWRMVGRPAPHLGGRVPELDLQGCSVVEVRDGRMVRAWLYADEGRIDALLALAAGDPPD